LARQVALLRGINVGAHRRIPMPALRELLTERGFGEVRTYVQSGNVVLSSDLGAPDLGRAIEQAIAERFSFDDIPIVIRSRDELARVVALDPLRSIVTEDKHYQVAFLSDRLKPEVVAALAGEDVAPEAVHVEGREIYTWHPDGIQRSKLTKVLAEKRLGVIATARNWTTVTTLLAMLDE
jgi:uncharacterized protein (DUF1697 family)